MASDAVSRFFSTFGSVTGVDVPDPNKAQCLVTFAALEPAAAAQAATNKRACDALGGRTLWVEFARDPEEVRRDDAAAAEVAHLDPQHKQQELWCPAVRDSADLGVPGATLVRDFVTPEEEREILAAVDADTRWQRLAKRRVLHYGFAFDYGTRDARSRARPRRGCATSSSNAPPRFRSRGSIGSQPAINSRSTNTNAAWASPRTSTPPPSVPCSSRRRWRAPRDGVSTPRGKPRRHADAPRGHSSSTQVAPGDDRRGEVQVAALRPAQETRLRRRRGRRSRESRGGCLSRFESEGRVRASVGGRTRVTRGWAPRSCSERARDRGWWTPREGWWTPPNEFSIPRVGSPRSIAKT